MVDLEVREYSDGSMAIRGPHDKVNFVHVEGEEGVPDEHEVILDPEVARALKMKFRAEEAL